MLPPLNDKLFLQAVDTTSTPARGAPMKNGSLR